MLRRYIEKTVEKILSEKYKAEKAVLPEGFHPADRIRGGVHHWLALPFGGTLVTCKLRTLGAGEFPAVSLVERAKKAREDNSYENRVWLLNTQEEYCRKALVVPSFAEFEEIVLGEDGAARKTREEFRKAKAEAEAHADNRTREAALAELRELEMAAGYFLPPDFMAAVAAWCECLEVTGIKLLKPEDLENAYIMSLHYHNRASDNIGGVYLEHTRREIDIAAAETYHARHPKKR
jgi:hypothetical protein